MRTLALATALLVATACDPKSTNVATREARLRTGPLATFVSLVLCNSETRGG